MRRGGYVEEPTNEYGHIYLTHDVDLIWQWDNFWQAFRTFAGRLLFKRKNLFESLLAWADYEKYDRLYTFPWMAELDQEVINYYGEDRCTSVYFIKTGGRTIYDDSYVKKTDRVKRLISFLKKSGAEIGIHASFSAGEIPGEIVEEKKRLEEILGENIQWNRNHFLLSKNPEDMQSLILAGITDDFTMGYADTVGFRLGTCRAVRWIDPISKEVTPLTMHPLTVMECTLDSERYMNLSAEEAYSITCKMLDSVRQFHGEAVLLWHNTSVSISETSYQRELYEKVLCYIKGGQEE